MEIQPRKHVLLDIDHADYTVPIRQLELDHKRIGHRSCVKYLDHELAFDGLSELRYLAICFVRCLCSLWDCVSGLAYNI